MKATAIASPTTWDEKPYNDLPLPIRMTKASVEFSFKGQLEGHGQTEFLMYYSEYNEKDVHKSTAFYIGLTRFVGTLSGKTGSFVLEERGSFGAGTAKSTSAIVPGSGTEQLKGISGSATSTATQTGSQFELEYQLP